MPLYSIDEASPRLAPGAWAAPSADLIGDIALGERASVWFNAVIRADNGTITIGPDTNIQDGAVCHSDPDAPLAIGRGVTVGHKAILHGCTIGAGCLIGMGATILNHAVIGEGCIVGAGALVTEKKEFPPHSLIVGSPARVVRTLGPDVAAMLKASADLYAAKAAHYARDLRLL
jgi:carbonic anhydrase/acetyltransferase-like protein (isoleucine patch superfamily)